MRDEKDEIKVEKKYVQVGSGDGELDTTSIASTLNARDDQLGSIR